MRKLYIITYDISDPKRLRATYRCMRGFGQWLQLSVFRCELNQQEVIALKSALHRVIQKGSDQVIIFDMGPVDGTAENRISWLGRPIDSSDQETLVV